LRHFSQVKPGQVETWHPLVPNFQIYRQSPNIPPMPKTENFSESWLSVWVLTGIDGYLWELKWNWKFQFFCQKWFQTENFSESWYSVWVLTGIDRHWWVSKWTQVILKISVKVGTLCGYWWALTGIDGYLRKLKWNWKFLWKLVLCVGIDGHWRALMGIYGNSSDTEIFSFWHRRNFLGSAEN